MPRLPFGRILLFSSLALLSAFASALDLNFASIGTGAELRDLGAGEYMITADQTAFVTQSTTPQGPAFTDAYFGLTRIGGKCEATLAYRDDQSTNTMNLALDVESDRTANGVRTISGNWRFLSGDGEYSDYSKETSRGRWTFRWTLAGNVTGLDLQGELNDRGQVPPPEPPRLAGLVLPVLMRRKRR